ncbi:MAG: hypothetical protein ACRCTA_01420, partial [Bacilli bacterium]
MNKSINDLLNYALDKQLIKERDLCFYINILSNYTNTKPFTFKKTVVLSSINQILEKICEESFNGTITENLKSKLISLLMASPSIIEQQFYSYPNIKEATSFFYQYNIDTYYIKEEANQKNIIYQYCEEGNCYDITINLGKPEK